jgi:hypothetical protein
VVLHDGMRNACSLLFLEGRSFGISLLDASTRTMLFFSLYIISNRLCFLRSCKVVHSSCSIMLLTDEVLWYRLVTYRAALLWTIWTTKKKPWPPDIIIFMYHSYLLFMWVNKRINFPLFFQRGWKLCLDSELVSSECLSEDTGAVLSDGYFFNTSYLIGSNIECTLQGVECHNVNCMNFKVRFLCEGKIRH